jgi:hypothetical protein
MEMLLQRGERFLPRRAAAAASLSLASSCSTISTRKIKDLRVRDGGGNVGLLCQNQIPKGGREFTRVMARGGEARRPKAAERVRQG